MGGTEPQRANHVSVPRFALRVGRRAQDRENRPVGLRDGSWEVPEALDPTPPVRQEAGEAPANHPAPGTRTFVAKETVSKFKTNNFKKSEF